MILRWCVTMKLRGVSTHCQTSVIAIFGSKTTHARVAVCCSMLQCVAVCCSVLQFVAVKSRRVSTHSHMSTLYCFSIATFSSKRTMLQCVAVCCSVTSNTKQTSKHVYQTRVHTSVLQRAAVCCSVLQCVAVCCSVLQCVAISHSVAS